MESTTEDELEIYQLLDAALKNKKTIIVSGGVGLFIALVYAFFAKEVFFARAVVMSAGSENLQADNILNRYGGLASLTGFNIGNKSGIGEQAIETLKSYHFQTRFLIDSGVYDKLRLDKDPSKYTVQDALEIFNKKMLSINEPSDKNVIIVGIHWTDPQEAAKWVNLMIDSVNSLMRSNDIREAELAISFLEEKLKKSSVLEIRQSIYSLIEAQTKKIMLANVRVDYALKVLDAAYAPEKRTSPKRKKIVVVGLLLGLFLAVLIIGFRTFKEGYDARRTLTI